jgi:DNA adenine methylase
LGDINRELINAYIEVKYRVDSVIKVLSAWPKSKKRYLALRALPPNVFPPSARAARFIYLNRCCFNGLYRTNRNGDFNVPYGGDGSGEIPGPAALIAASKALKGARLLAGDFTKVLAQVQIGDFVYMDPPFSITARRMFNEYDASAFGLDQLVALRKAMENFADRKVKFLVSYAESAEAELLRRGFKSTTVSVRRNISGFAAHRARSTEILIYN